MQEGTELISMAVTTCHDSLRQFGRYKSGHQLPIVCHPTNASFPYVSIPHGVYAFKEVTGVIQKDPMPPGFHFMKPWESIKSIVTPQYTHFDIPIKDCPTKDNVMVKIDVELVFKIVKPYKFIMGVSAEKLTDLLRYSQEEAVRNLARKTLHNKIYDLFLVNDDEIIGELNKKFQSQYGVEISDFMITGVQLPNAIHDRLQRETTYVVNKRHQMRKQTFDLLQIKNSDELKLCDMNHQNDRLKYVEEQKKKRKFVQKKVDEVFARTEKRCNEINYEGKRTAQKIVEDAKKISEKLDAKRTALLLEIDAKAKATKDKLFADLSTFEEQEKSKLEYILAQNNSKKIMVTSEAESISSKKMIVKRKFIEDQRKVELLGALSKNGNSVIQGSTNGNIIAQLAASKYQNNLYN